MCSDPGVIEVPDAYCTPAGCEPVSTTLAASACNAARRKASALTLLGTAKCAAKAAKTETAVDPECTAKVEAKILKLWGNAVKKDDCADPDPAAGVATALAKVEECASSIESLLDGPFTGRSGSGCCEWSGFCSYTDNGVCPGALLEDGWCNADGTCSAAPPTQNGNCCALSAGTPLGDALRAGGTLLSEFVCPSLPGTYVPDSLCSPTGCAPLP